jgi:MFS transporter, DHA1 family, multidrug resistance protein
MSHDHPRLPPLWLLFAMMFVGQMATTIYLPGLPDIARDLGTSLSSAQTLVPAYLAIFALAQLIVGPLSDRLGRRPVIVAAIGVFTLASLACALAPDIVTLLLARFAQAAGACATIVVSRAMVRDTSTGVAAAQAMSYLAIALGVGPATAPFIGGFLTTGFGWQSTFIATALVGAGVLVCVIALLNETLPREMRNPPPPSELLRDYLQLLRNRPFVVYGLTMAFTAAAAATYLTSIPIVFIVLMDVSPEMLGTFIMIMPPLFMMATYISRRLSNRMSLDRLILIGAFISAGGGLLQVIFGVMQVTTPYPVMLAFGISNFGTGFVFANCLAQALNAVPPAIAGSASGLSGFMHIGWGAVVSLAVASMIHTSSLQLGIAQMATTWLALASALFLYYVVKRRPA